MFNLPRPSPGSMTMRFRQWRIWSAMWAIRQLRAANPQINRDLFIMYAAENGLNNLLPWADTEQVPEIDQLVKLYTPRLKVFYWAKMAGIMADIIDDCWAALTDDRANRVLIPNRVYPAISSILNAGGKDTAVSTYAFVQIQLKSALASYRISYTTAEADTYSALTMEQARRVLGFAVEQARFKLAGNGSEGIERQLGPTDAMQHLANGAELALYFMIGAEDKWDVQRMIDSSLAVTGVIPGHEDEELYSECLGEVKRIAKQSNPAMGSPCERVLLWVASLPESLAILTDPRCDYKIPWPIDGDKQILLSVRSMRRGLFYYVMTGRRLSDIAEAKESKKDDDSKVSMDSAMRIQKTIGYFAPAYNAPCCQ